MIGPNMMFHQVRHPNTRQPQLNDVYNTSNHTPLTLTSLPLSDDMASWAPKLPFSHSKAEEKDETSLTTLLTADQCSELTFLIATITATMRKSLLRTFTAEEVQPDAKPSKDEEDTLANAPSDLDNVDIAKEDKIKKEREVREENARQELVQAEVQELKIGMLE